MRTSILEVTGVLSVHELHVWQLSESKIVASVHVMASRKVDFMPIAANVRKALHHHGIHSSTIQPEYYHPAVSPPEENLMVGSFLYGFLTGLLKSVCSTDIGGHVVSYSLPSRRTL